MCQAVRAWDCFSLSSAVQMTLIITAYTSFSAYWLLCSANAHCGLIKKVLHAICRACLANLFHAAACQAGDILPSCCLALSIFCNVALRSSARRAGMIKTAVS
ncbi:TPA: hypothetical protein ACH3X3_003912 [Trebouxia sp. C0006]